MPKTEKIAIEVKDLHKSFRNGKDVVLDGLTVNFPEGKLTYILGPSGTGKSVTIKHILALMHQDSGKIIVHGRDVSEIKGADNLSEYREQFGMLFQNAALFDDMTVFENVAFPLKEHTNLSHSEIEKLCTEALTTLGMAKGYDKYPNELSGGMRKRVGLARAIVRKPKILLYDEPTTGLDPVTRTTVDDLIATIKKDLSLTSIVISHDIPAALLLADQIVFLFEGKAVFIGTPLEFRDCKHPKVHEFMEAETRTIHALQGAHLA